MHQWEGAVKEERFPHTSKALRGQKLQVTEGGSFGATEESTTTGVRGQTGEIPAQRIGADQHSPD